MKKFLLAMLLTFVVSKNFSQVQQAWVARANGVENKDESGGIIGRDAAGFIYVAGHRSGTAELEDEGFLTIKYNPVTGAVMWAHINNGAGNGRARPADMFVDPAGNVYLAGTGGPTSHGQEWFMIKYNTNGVQLWEDSYTNSASGETAAAITADAQGNAYITGYSFTNHVQSITTMKYDASGDRKWIRYYSGTDTDGAAGGRDIAVDAAGNVYVTGYARYDGTNRDLVILKYSTDGVLLSSNRYDGPDEDEPVAMVLDANANIYIAAQSRVTNHGFDFLTLKYNSNCNIIWERLYNGAQNKGDHPNDIAVDAAGNVIVAGYTPVNSAGTDIDQLVIKYDANGNFQWEKTYGHVTDIDNVATAVAVDNLGNIYTTGYSGELGGRTALVDYITIKYNPDGVQQWLQLYDGPPGFSDEGRDILVDPSGNVYVTGTSARTAADDDIATIKYTQCGLVCPSNITVNNDPGKCHAVVNYDPVTYTGDCGSTFTYSHNSGAEFPVGTTTVTVTSDETGATCSFTITVVDNVNPVITNCPASKTVNTEPGVCYASSGVVNAGVAAASDNCLVTVTGIRSDQLSLGANYPVGNTTITWTARDASGNTATCSQTITVADNQPPEISGESASTYVLTPANHTMRDVVVNYTATDNCAVTTTLIVTSNEPVNGTGDGDTDPDWIVVDNHHVKLRAERSANGNGRIYTITIRAVDTYGNVTTKTLEVHVPHDIRKPHSGVASAVNSTINFEGEFWDRAGNRHTSKWLLDGVVVASGTVTEPTATQNGKVTGSYRFTAPGVYKLQMNITDQTGFTTSCNTRGDLEAIVVIYDPNGGYTYGGGWFNSPAGALAENPSSTGKGSFGFAINYRNAAKPKGETQFEFKVGNFEFNALNFDYLVVSGYKAQFRGTGKITGGQSGINFIMTVIDGRLDGTGVDKVRLKIFKNNGVVIYDNQPGASDAANPTSPVGDNSIVYISSTQTSTVRSSEPDQEQSVYTSDKLEITAFPNPSDKEFTLKISSNDLKTPVKMIVTDENGRVLEIRNRVHTGTAVLFGKTFRPGVYFINVIQGANHRQMKLVKL